MCEMRLRHLAARRTVMRWGVCRLVELRGLVMAAVCMRWTAAACWMAWCCPVAPPALGLGLVALVTLVRLCVRVWQLVLLRWRLLLVTCHPLRRVWRLVMPLLCQLCLPQQLDWRRCVVRRTVTACTARLMVC